MKCFPFFNRWRKVYRENISLRRKLAANPIDPLQHYYFKQRVKELEEDKRRLQNADFYKINKSLREEIELVLEQNNWLINHYEERLWDLNWQLIQLRSQK